MEKIDTVIINWYNQGIAISETVDIDTLQNKKQELSKQGITYWVTDGFARSTQQVRYA